MAETQEAGPWDDYAPQAAERGPWDDYAPAEQPKLSLWERGAVHPTTLTTSDVGKVGEIGKMFGTHFEDNFTADRLGFSRENYALVDKALKDSGVLAPDGKDKDASWRSPFYAMNNLIFQAVDSSIAAGTLPLRGMISAYEAAKATAIDLGLPKDVASLGDPFMANPGHLGIPKAPGARAVVVKKALVDGGMDEAAANRVAANIAEPHQAPLEQQAALSADDIYAVASTMRHDRETMPIIREVNEIAGAVRQGASFEDAIQGRSTEAIEAIGGDRLFKKLAKTWKVEKENHYVDEGATLEHSDTPVDEFIDYVLKDGAGKVKARASLGIHGDTATLADINLIDRNGDAIPADRARNLLGPSVVRTMLREFRKDYPAVRKIAADRVSGARVGGEFDVERGQEIEVNLPTQEELVRAKEILSQDGSWISDLIERGNEAVDIEQAADLGVVGPKKIAAAIGDSPSELADRAMPHNLSGAATPEDMRGSLGHKPGEYDKRGKEWIDKIDEPDGVRDAIEKIASDHDFFPEARGGIASSAARDAVAEAAGVNPADIDAMHFARTFDNDGKVRAVVQTLRQTANDVVSASEKTVKEPSIENMAALTEAQLRHTHVLEYTLGLRAESGRSLAAWKDLLKETEHSKARVALKSGEETDAVPKGTAAIVDAVKDVQDNLKAPEKGKIGLQNLIDKAIDLVGKADTEKVARPGLSPELSDLVNEARNVLKRFGADKDAELDAFRQSLEKLASGDGKINDTVEAARELLKKNEKPPKPGAPKPPKEPSERGRLMGAAKRLVQATDELAPEAKAPISVEMARLMEAARQAVGRIKTQKAGSDLANFKDALNAGDHERAVAAAKSLVEAEEKATPAGPKPPVEHDQVMNAARKLAKAGVEGAEKTKQPLPPDIVSLLDEAKKAAGELEKANKSALGGLIEAAENQVTNLLKQKAVKNPVEALPPELQELVNKSQRVTNRFGGIARGEKAAYLLASTGKTIAEQEQLARSVAGLTPNQVAKVLEKLRTMAGAEKPGWQFWGYQQGLIAGLFTHAGYSIVNVATLMMERVIAPTLAAVIGKARGQNVSVMAPIHSSMAFIHALPDAVIAAGQAFKTGTRIPLESEMRLFARGEESPQSKAGGAAYVQGPAPEWGLWKKVFNEDQLDVAAKVLGVPGRSANLQHTFFKVLSERAAQDRIAYEAAAKEGVTGDKFQERLQYHQANPTDDALRMAVNEAYSGAFMAKLDGQIEKWSSFAKNNRYLRWAFPFNHIPWNIILRGVEWSPFALLGPEMSAAIMGKKGMPAQNLAISKMALGTSISGWFMHKFFAGEATADYPIDPEEQRKWKMLGTQPNSLKIGGYWVSMDRLGPIGSMAHLGASIGNIIHHYKGDAWDEELLRASLLASAAAVNHFGNEAGFQTIRNFMEAQRSEKGFEKFWALQAGTAIPFSSFLGQDASFIDPYERQAHTILSGLKYKIPFVREGLLPNRDPLYGEAIPNPGYHTIKRMAEITADPVKMELDRLGIYPAAPEDRIGGVKLPPKMYDEYQALAGTFVQRALHGIVAQEGWQNVPPFARQTVLRGAISSAREAARAIIQVRHKEIVQAGIEQRMDQIQGRKPTGKLQDAQ